MDKINERSTIISFSFCPLSVYLFSCVSFVVKNSVLCQVSLVKWLNRALGRGLTHYRPALLVFTASRRVDLTVFIASHLPSIHCWKINRLHWLAKRHVSSERTPKVLLLYSMLCWFVATMWDSTQRSRDQTLIRKRGTMPFYVECSVYTFFLV